MKNRSPFSILLMFFVALPLGCDSGSEPLKPDEQFVKILLQSGFRDEVDTFSGTLTKDLVVDGIITIPFWLTKAEQEAILSELTLENFFNLPDTLPAMQGVTISPNPSPDLLRVEVGGELKTVLWSYPLDPVNQNSQTIIRLTQVIKNVIESKEEFKRLPPAKGGYH